VLGKAQREQWERDGFVILREFVPESRCTPMLARATEIARAAIAGADVAPALIVAEGRRPQAAGLALEQISKVFKIHRTEPVFGDFCRYAPLLDAVADLIGPDLDCFLSQFIFKPPAALGQPWHQDAYYFPFDRGPQVGAWLAVTEAAQDNGPLWVLPGSHREPIHAALPDRRERANVAYVEIVDHDMTGAVPALMQPGDLLMFHSHLMHRSTDNTSERLRAAMVYHYGTADTVDQSVERLGFALPNVDWLPVRRA
jgi:phytanoyl-CoA hydroxylase